MLEEVARERYPRLVARALLLTRSRDEAEDLVQDALVATFGGRARFATAAQAEQYVRRAIVSRFVDSTRRAGRERLAVTAVGRQSLARPDEPGLSGAVESALGLLSPRQRACVVLRHLEDLSVRETAQLLGLSEGTVKRYVAEGVATLSRVLGATAPPEHTPVLLIDEEARHDA
jgi:RNA polymerase sigma factor (sigma-70 family)